MSLIPRRFRPFTALLLLVLPAALAGLGAGLPSAASASVISVVPNRPVFSPNADGQLDDVTVVWVVSPAAESILVRIWPEPRDSAFQAPVRVFTFGPTAVSGSVIWDGRDGLGALLPDSLYRIQARVLAADGDTVGAALAVTVRLDTTAPPEPTFDDGFDGSRVVVDDLTLTGSAPQAEFVYLFADGMPVDTVRIATTDPAFEFERTLVTGVNSFALQSIDRGANRSVLGPPILVTYANAADLAFLRVVPFEHSPNGDGVADTLRLTTSLDAPTTRLRVEIRATVPPLTGAFADTSTLYALHDGPADAGEHVYTWDGRDSSGTVVADGNWFGYARADSIDGVGNPIPGRPIHTRFVVDTTPPSTPVLDAGIATLTTHNTITLSGNATGADTVHVERGGGVVARPTGPRFSTTVNLLLGSNAFTFRGVDRAGNRSAPSAPFVVVYEEPVGFFAPERFRAGDRIELNLGKTARAVRLDIFDLTGRRVRTLQQNQLGRNYEFPWNVQDDTGRTVGDGPYVIKAQIAYEDGSNQTASGAVVVAK